MIKKGYFITLFTLIAVAGLFQACEKDIANNGIPAFIKIDTMTVSTGTGQGSASHKITDAWVFIDNEPIGTFELPALIPILEEGTHTLLVRGGIKMNGIAATRVPYPMYQFYEQQITLIKDCVVTVTPAIQYFPGIQFPYIEDFTSGGVSLIAAPGISDVDIQRLTSGPDLLQGPCGAILMPPGQIDTALFYTNTNIELPINGTVVYLELDYKNNFPFVMGLYVNNPSNVIQKQLFQFNQSEQWNKIYINLTDYVSAETSALDFNLFFGAIKVGEDTTKDVKIFIDNVKLVTQ